MESATEPLVQYRLAVRTRSASGNGDYEWNPRLPSSAQWWLKWAPDIVFRNPTLIRDVDSTGGSRVYLNGIVGSRPDHVNRRIKYELAIFSDHDVNCVELGSFETLNSEEIENLVSTWWQLHSTDRLAELGNFFDAALAAHSVSDRQIDELDASVNRAVASAIRNLQRTNPATKPESPNNSEPSVVGEHAPGATALINSDLTVLYSAGLNDKVFAEYEGSGRLQPSGSVVIANSKEPLRLRFPTAATLPQVSQTAIGDSANAPNSPAPQRSSARPAPGGGCLVYLLLVAAFLSSVIAGMAL